MYNKSLSTTCTESIVTYKLGLVWYPYSYFEIAIQNRVIKKCLQNKKLKLENIFCLSKKKKPFSSTFLRPYGFYSHKLRIEASHFKRICLYFFKAGKWYNHVSNTFIF